VAAPESMAFQKSQFAVMLDWWVMGLTAPVVCLSTAVITPDVNTPLSSLPEPVGSWYTRVPAVFQRAFENADNSLTLPCACAQFNYSGTDAPETIASYFLVDEALSGDQLISARQVQTQVTMGTVLDSIRVEPAITFPPAITV